VRSVDTNVVARFLLGDDTDQSMIAGRVLSEGAFISLTVLLETSWLLRSRYKLSPAQIIGLVNVLREHVAIQIEGEEWLDWLLDSFAQGLDFADLVHLVASKNLSSFATFDRDIGRYVQSNAPVTVEIL
jgi:predicted nucleic-acid-binding protein